MRYHWYSMAIVHVYVPYVHTTLSQKYQCYYMCTGGTIMVRARVPMIPNGTHHGMAWHSVYQYGTRVRTRVRSTYVPMVRTHADVCPALHTCRTVGWLGTAVVCDKGVTHFFVRRTTYPSCVHANSERRRWRRPTHTAAGSRRWLV